MTWQPRFAVTCAVLLTSSAVGHAQLPAATSSNRLTDAKQQLGASDEEWKVIGPKLQKVIAARLALGFDERTAESSVSGGPGGGRSGSPFRGPGGGGPGSGAPAGGPGGGFGPPRPGEILPPHILDHLNLTGDQRTQYLALQKDVDARLQKILTPQQARTIRELPPPPGGRAGGPGSSGGPPGSHTPTVAVTGAVQQAQADLQACLKDASHTPAEIQERVVAVRRARQKARADLDVAQKDLLQLLTTEQQAVLLALGYLD